MDFDTLRNNLEAIVNETSLDRVLDALADMCQEKAAMATNMMEHRLAGYWLDAAARIAASRKAAKKTDGAQ